MTSKLTVLLLTNILLMLSRGMESQLKKEDGNRLQKEQNKSEETIPINVYVTKKTLFGPLTLLDEEQVQDWLSNCLIRKVYKVADTGAHTSIYHQAVMIRSDLPSTNNPGQTESCKNFGLLIHFDGFREQLLKDLAMTVKAYEQLSSYNKVKFRFKAFKEGYFRVLDSQIKIELVQVIPNELYSRTWEAPDKSDTNQKSLNFFFDKHKDREMVQFKDGLNMQLSTLKKFIQAVPLAKYRNWPSNKYFNCWRGSNYIIYAFTQLRDCRDKLKDENALRSDDELVSTCFPEISENLKCRKKYNSKRVNWSKNIVMPQDLAVLNRRKTKEEGEENSNKI